MSEDVTIEECERAFLDACYDDTSTIHDALWMKVRIGIKAVRNLALSRRPSPSGDIEAIVRDTVGRVLAETTNDGRKPPCNAEIEEWSNAIRAALAREGEPTT